MSAYFILLVYGQQSGVYVWISEITFFVFVISSLQYSDAVGLGNRKGIQPVKRFTLGCWFCWWWSRHVGVRCRTVAVLRRWYRTLWASTTLAVESSTDLFVASNWLADWNDLLVGSSHFARIQSSISQYFTSSNHLLCGFYLNFLLKLASKASKLIRPPADWSTAVSVTSHAAVNSGARNIQISKYSYMLLSKHASCYNAIRPNYYSHPQLMAFTLQGLS